LDQPTVATRYGAEEGAEYLAYQAGGAELEARIAAGRFQPYLTPDATVVDFGCGTGWLLNVLDTGPKIGIEPNPKARDIANSFGITTVASPSQLEDASADTVISNHALEHSLAPHSELVELLRILKPGGRLVIGLPLDDWRAQKRVDPADLNHHLYTWTPQLLSNLLVEAGFRVESVRAFTYLQPYYNHILFPRLPRPVFDLLARGFGHYKRYRQVFAVATRPA
jgi:SAM-dependent methyltransferase